MTFLIQYLDCLWEQIKTMREDSWQEKHIRRPYQAFHSIMCKALPVSKFILLIRKYDFL